MNEIHHMSLVSSLMTNDVKLRKGGKAKKFIRINWADKLPSCWHVHKDGLF
jgi:hypothetical protein